MTNIVRHTTVPELGNEALGLGSLTYATLDTSSNPVIWDFELKASSNALLLLSNPITNLNITNIPNGASGNLVVVMGSTGNETINFSNNVTRVVLS